MKLSKKGLETSKISHKKTLFALFLIIVVLSIAACGTRSDYPTGYAGYQQQPGQQQYVGGGCGVAPSDGYGEAPVDEVLGSIAA